jgi:hypothetical protein
MSLKIRFNITIPSTFRSCKFPLPSGSVTKTMNAFVIALMHATSPVHLIVLDLVKLIIYAYCKSRNYSLFCLSFFPSPFLCPNILLNTSFSSTFNLFSFFSVRGQSFSTYATFYSNSDRYDLSIVRSLCALSTKNSYKTSQILNWHILPDCTPELLRHRHNWSC